MAQTLEDVLRNMLGQNAMQIAAMSVEIQTLREKIAVLESKPSPDA